ncbi:MULTISPECIES: LysR family transcriptional regulator [unclassified Pseudomonas]|uniref:LysR family transcriptional regulator n=1 Tax=unclassified Pseudomonas TaxID=196821 RepID=UPI001645E0AD|nr:MULTISPECIES: LysR family transcriptional regulator [unclassified Pseudomonas]MBC3272321.1 LysR family transcriptional regulator [Pseudomonas sp. SWRI81]MBC3775622.1 LysR family transcriptional regulator [Pseudomonas sp. SWRI99]
MHSHLNRVQTFLAVVDFGSYTKAANYLSISKAMASLHVKALEEVLSATLLIRNTRNISLTEIGQEFYEEFKGIIADIDNAFDNVLKGNNRVSGKLRISSTSEYGEKFILPLIPLFTEHYPDIRLCYNFNSSLNDLVAEKLDLVVRLGNLADSAFKSRKLADYEIVLVATEGFLARHAVRQPQDLNGVPWIANSNLQAPTQWRLRDGLGGEIEVNGTSHFESNSSTAIRSMTLSSLGVSVLPAWVVEDDIASGRLVRLLPGYSLPSQSINVVFPNTPHLPHKSRVFIDFLLVHLGQ